MIKQKMTTKQARDYIDNYTGDSVTDAYLNMDMLRAICYALPTTEEAMQFLWKVRRNANTEAVAFGVNFKRQKRNALKLQQELEQNLTLF